MKCKKCATSSLEVLEIGSKSCLKKAIKGAVLFQKLAELFGWTGRKALTGPGNTGLLFTYSFSFQIGRGEAEKIRGGRLSSPL